MSKSKGGCGAFATTPKSKKLDTNVKQVSRNVAKSLCLKHKTKYVGTAESKGYNPDGGIFYLDSKPVLVIEAKHQGRSGNAIERWGSLYLEFKTHYPDIHFLTFASGLGAHPTEVIGRTLRTTHPDGFNNLTGSNSAYLSEEGFTLEQLEVIITNKLLTLV